MIENLYVPMELKFAGSTGADVGTFSGYGAVFGNVDDGGDMIVPGAFAASLAKLKAANRGIPMYMQHGAALGADPRPVGKWMVVEEDAHGLRVEGKLIGLDTETGRFNHALVKEGAMTGLSIGYRVKKADYGKKPGDPRRTLKEVDLGEISIVDQPMNALSRLTNLKSIGFTERDIERWLTQDAGLSRREARIVINTGFKALIAMQDAGEDLSDGTQDAADELVALAEALKRNADRLKPA